MTNNPTYAMLYDFDNLWLAWLKAARGKRGRDAVAQFEYRLEDHLIELQEVLRNKTHRPKPYASFYIHEPKRRLISAAPFPDRVVHHAVCNLLEPVFERGFIDNSFTNRVGKGTHRALAPRSRAGRIPTGPSPAGLTPGWDGPLGGFWICDFGFWIVVQPRG